MITGGGIDSPWSRWKTRLLRSFDFLFADEGNAQDLENPVLHAYCRILLCVGDVVAQIDEKLSEASLRCCVVAEDGLEGCVAERFRETLPEGFAGAVVVA